MPNTSLQTGLFDAAWLKHIRLKVSVFVWRLLRNRLPTKDNLLRRRVLQHNDVDCVGGCGNPETMCHLFFWCDFFGSLWHLVYQWIGINFTPPGSVSEHLHQFGHLVGLPRFTYSFFQVIWHAGCWVVWKERNNKIFPRQQIIWRTLSFCPLLGWKLKCSHPLSIILIGGGTLYYVWVLRSSFSSILFLLLDCVLLWQRTLTL